MRTERTVAKRFNLPTSIRRTEVGGLYLERRFGIVCARTDDTWDGCPTSCAVVGVGTNGRPCAVNSAAVADHDLHRQIVAWLLAEATPTVPFGIE